MWINVLSILISSVSYLGLSTSNEVMGAQQLMQAGLLGSTLPNTPYDAALILIVALHVEVTIVSNCEDMWWHLPDLLVGVQAYLLRRVDG